MKGASSACSRPRAGEAPALEEPLMTGHLPLPGVAWSSMVGGVAVDEIDPG